MNRNQLKGAYSEGEAQAIYLEVKQSGGDFAGFLRQFMHDEDYQVARNALWGTTKADDRELAVVKPMMPDLIALALSTDNASVRRLALNLVERLAKEAQDIPSEQFVALLDFCLEHMVRLDEYPGIQSLCMKLAYRMSRLYPELEEEMMRIVESMEISLYKPAVRSVWQKIKHGKMKNRPQHRQTHADRKATLLYRH